MLDEEFRDRILTALTKSNEIMRELIEKISDLDKRIAQLEEHAIIPGES